MFVDKYGDIMQSTAHCLVVPVNCEGVMGAGLAGRVKQMSPEVETLYQKYHRDGLIKINSTPTASVIRGRMFIFFPTKDKWREPSRLEWIEFGLKELASVKSDFDRYFTRAEFRGIAFPRLGCGLGGLNWVDVRALFEQYLGNSEAEIELWHPFTVNFKPKSAADFAAQHP